MLHLSNLLSLVLSPAGMLLSVASIYLLLIARSKPFVPWLFLSLLVVSASFTRFRNEWVLHPPPFIGPIDTMVSNGRPLALLLLALLLIMPVRHVAAPIKLPVFALALLATHAVIALKNLAGGSLSFAILSIATLAMVFSFFARFYTRWLQRDEDIDAGILAIAGAAALFTALNAIQYIVDPSALAVANGRFNGTTGNPQHAAVFLSVGIPALFYVALTRRGALRLGAIATALFATLFLFWSGSRTGLLMSLVCTLLLFRNVGRPGMLAVLAAAAMGFGYRISQSGEAIEFGRFTSLQDTRSEAWAGMWRNFLDNPVFGVALTTDRLGYGENSWLAVASSAGLVGLLPMLVAGIALLIIARRLIQERAPNRKSRVQGDFLAGSILGLVVGSIFEAFLLAVVSSSILLTISVGLMGMRRLALNSRNLREFPQTLHPRARHNAGRVLDALGGTDR